MEKPRKKPGPKKGAGGRPPKAPEERKIDVGVRMTRAELDQIDTLAGKTKGARSAMIRELVAEALEARATMPRKRQRAA